ncbi:MAG: DUF4926 domain-containing protein [Desulfobacterales bacterium]|nr:DUF4926 domain-containing protein [Desulfobacterales bacterium]
MINELDTVVLAEDISYMNLKKGDMGTVVLVHKNGEGYEVEFMTLDGDTIGVTTLLPSQIRMIQQMEIASARPLELLAA